MCQCIDHSYDVVVVCSIRKLPNLYIRIYESISNMLDDV